MSLVTSFATSATCQSRALPPCSSPSSPFFFDYTDFHFSGIYNFQGSEPAAMFRSKFSVTKSVWVGYSAGSGAADSGAGLYFHTPFITNHSCEIVLFPTK